MLYHRNLARVSFHIDKMNNCFFPKKSFFSKIWIFFKKSKKLKNIKWIFKNILLYYSLHHVYSPRDQGLMKFRTPSPLTLTSLIFINPKPYTKFYTLGRQQRHCDNGQPSFIVYITPDFVKWVKLSYSTFQTLAFGFVLWWTRCCCSRASLSLQLIILYSKSNWNIFNFHPYGSTRPPSNGWKSTTLKAGHHHHHN